MKKNKKKNDLKENNQFDEEYNNLNNLRWIVQQENKNILKYIFCILLLVLLIIFFNVKFKDKFDLVNLKIYKKFVNDCFKLKRNKIYDNNNINIPYLSICLSALNFLFHLF